MSTSAPDLFEQAGAAWNVDPMLLRAIDTIESHGDPRAISSKGAVGRMQLMPATAQALGVTDSTDPAQSIFGGAKLMRQNLDAANGDVVTALKFYQGGRDPTNWGPQNAAYPVQVLTKLRAGQQTAAQQQAQAAPPQNDAFSAAFGLAPAQNDDAVINATVGRLRAGQAPAGQQATPQAAPDSQDAFSAATAAPAAQPQGDAFSAAFGLSQAAPTAAAAPTATPNLPMTADPNATMWDNASAPADGGAVGRIATAAVQGATPALTTGGSNFGVGPETTALMQRVGVFPPAQGGGTLMQNLNQGAANAVAAPVNLLMRGVNGLIGGAQAGVVQAGEEAENTPAGQAMARSPTWNALIGVGGPAQLARDIAAMPEAFPFGVSRGVPDVPASAARSNMLLPQEARVANAATDSTPMLLPQDFRVSPTLSGNSLVPSAVGAVEPNRLLPQAGEGTPTVAATPDAASTSSGPTAPIPTSGGAAATPPSAIPNMTPDEALAQRTQGERNRFNTPPRGQDTTIYIPGTTPTLAEVAADPKASLQQKVVSQNAATMEPLATQMQKNNDLTVQYYEDTAGSAQQLERMQAARDAQATTDLQTAFGNKQPTSVAPVQAAIQQILADPRNSENTALQRYIAPFQQRIADMQGVTQGVDASGQPALMADPEVLYGLREDLSRMLSKPALQKDPELAHVASQVRDVRTAMDGAIEQGAPGYQQYLTNYANASNPIDAMQFLQDARGGLTNQKGQILPGKFNSLMSNIVEDRATGNPYLPASKLTDDQMDNLFAIHSQLKRLGNIDLSNPRGSDTNMLGQAVSKLGLVGAHAVAGFVSPAIGNVGVEMGRNALAARRANRLLQGVLAPDPGKYPPEPMP